MRKTLTAMGKTRRQGDAETRRILPSLRLPVSPSPRLVFLALSAACLLSACERKIAESNLRVLKPEMTTKEVESILGAPNRVQSGPELVSREVKTLPVTRYIYEQNGEKFELTFVGDRLAEGPVKGAPSIEGKIGK